MCVYMCVHGARKGRERQKRGKMGWPGRSLKVSSEGTEPWGYHQGGELQGAGGLSIKSCSGSI